MLLRVMYEGKEYDTIKDVFSLDGIVSSDRIMKYYPSSAVIFIGCDQVGGNGDAFNGSERGQTYWTL